MTLLALDAELSGLLAKLHPYARAALEQAAAIALHLHAEELTPEHLLVSILEDEECGAARLVLHAFGDPETIGIEVLALCPGIMVVGSQRSLPFSLGGVHVLEQARGAAARRGDELVDIPHLLAAARERVPAQVATLLSHVTLDERADHAQPDTSRAVTPEGPLFRFFGQEARKALAAACRQAARLGRDEISAVHLVLGCLDVDTAIAEARQMRGLLRGLDADPAGREAREVPADRGLRSMLAALQERAGTVEILGWIIAHGGEEIRALLHRQRITQKLLEHAGKSFEDPLDIPRRAPGGAADSDPP